MKRRIGYTLALAVGFSLVCWAGLCAGVYYFAKAESAYMACGLFRC
jgi:hypothetical protein